MRKLTRRSFLKTGAAMGTIILTSSGLVPRIVFSDESDPTIKYRELGSTGFKVSEIGMGCMNTRDPELVHAAIDAGINFIDTASVYMNGDNEKIIGQVMKTKRNRVFLSTKQMVKNGGKLLPMMKSSLKRLQTDHVDLVMHHGVHTREDYANDDLIRQFEDLKHKGMTRFIGISTHNPETIIQEVLASNVWDTVEVACNYLSPPETLDAIKKAREAGIGIIAIKNILHYDTVTPLNDEIGAEKMPGTTPEQALIRWVLNNPFIDTTCPGMTTFEHLEDDLAVMNMDFSDDIDKLLKTHSEGFRGRYCLGFLGCRECEGRCPNGVSISEINRCLGYAFGYDSMKLARENYLRLPRGTGLDACKNCGTCPVKCAHGLDLASQIHTARSLFLV